MKKIKVTIAILFSVLLLQSCSLLKQTGCKSVKYVPVTYMTKDSTFYTINLPYCDTIVSNKPPTKVKQ